MNGKKKADKSSPQRLPVDDKQAKSLLRQTGKALSALTQASPLAIIALDRDAKVLLWNPAAEHLFGWTREEVQGQPYPLVPESELAAFRKLIEEEFKGTRHTGVELKRRHKDGSLVDVTIWTTPLHDPGGHMYGVLGMLADNSERKRTEQQLRLQGAALNATANAVMITDTEGRIEWVNPAYSRLTGYSPEEAIGKNPRQLVKSGKHDRAFYKNLWDTILAGNVWRSETINRRKDGSLYTEDQTIAPVRNERGEITHFVAIKQDISDRKLRDEKLRHLNRMYKITSGINMLIVHTSDRQELFNEACRIAVEEGEFRMVWVGMVSPDKQTVKPVAWAGWE